MERRADLRSSEVQMEELTALVKEGGRRLAAVFFVQHLHRHAFQLSHAGSECLEVRPGLWENVVCYHGKIEGFLPWQVWNACYPYSTKKGSMKNWNLHYSITFFPRTNSQAVQEARDLIPDSDVPE